MNISPDDNTLHAIYIGRLVFKEACKQPLTEQERVDLADWRDGNADRDQLYKALQDRAAVASDIRRLNTEYDPEEAAVRIFGQLGLDKESLKNKPRPVVLWRRGLSVAAAVILLVIGIWYLSLRSHQPSSAASVAGIANDIPPGGARAILTLADGSSIVLDSAHNGQLARQGSAQVVKANGQVSYRAESNNAAVVYNTMTTPKGGQYQLVLPDGTKVWLNAASSIRYPTVFQGQRREVEMTGEGYFEVARNTDMPFIVKTTHANVTVLGTHFNINAYDDERNTRVTLLQGAVRVNDAVTLSPGQQAIAGVGTRMVADIDTSAVVAWKDGKFQFGETADIETVMRQVARWYDVQVVYRGNITRHIGGTIGRDVTLSHLLKVLQATGAVHFKQDGKTIEVYP